MYNKGFRFLLAFIIDIWYLLVCLLNEWAIFILFHVDLWLDLELIWWEALGLLLFVMMWTFFKDGWLVIGEILLLGLFFEFYRVYMLFLGFLLGETRILDWLIFFINLRFLDDVRFIVYVRFTTFCTFLELFLEFLLVLW